MKKLSITEVLEAAITFASQYPKPLQPLLKYSYLIGHYGGAHHTDKIGLDFLVPELKEEDMVIKSRK